MDQTIKYFETYRMRVFYIAIALVLSSAAVQAQKVLQIERYGSPKTKKYFIGDVLTYQLKDDDTWYEGEIVDVNADDNIVVFHNRYARVEDIRAFRYDNPQKWSKPLGVNLIRFSGGWVFYSLIDILDFGNPFGWSAVIVPVTSLTLGCLLPKIFKYKVVKFGGRKRLRALNLTIGP